MILSEGVLWEGTPGEWPGWDTVYRSTGATPLQGGYWKAHAEIYRAQLWVAVVVNKLAMGEARLPMKVYERAAQGRPEADGHPYQALLRRPNRRHSRFFFWLWTVSTFDIFGESFWGKLRDKGGRPVRLAMLHPTGMHPSHVDSNGEVRWDYQNGTLRVTDIPESDLVHFRTYNPESMVRGLSRLEPLRRTLEFEDAAQRAQSSFWAKGARPGTLLTMPGSMSQMAGERLKVDWNRVAQGVDNTGETVILEEGLKPERWYLTAEEAQYVESRRLNRDEVCAAYDVPPPAVHILDRATFSNITEQMRSLYRDTHAPRLQLFESTLEQELRGSVRPGASDPDFGDDVYGEFLLDEVLRGAFEARAEAYKAADYMTLAEKRERENLPFVAGTDRIFVNAATIALEAVPLTPPKPGGPVTRSAGDLAANWPTIDGRLRRAKTVEGIDAEALVAGIASAGDITRAALTVSRDSGHTVEEFRQLLHAIAGGSTP